MKITITVAETVPDDAFERIETMAKELPLSASCFSGTEVVVRRTPINIVPTMVTDDDYFRQKLVELLVEQALNGGCDSIFGAL